MGGSWGVVNTRYRQSDIMAMNNHILGPSSMLKGERHLILHIKVCSQVIGSTTTNEVAEGAA